MDKLASMFSGEKINSTEGRPVLHVALRSEPTDEIVVDGENVVPEVHKVLKQIEAFSGNIRAGTLKGFTDKPLKNIVAIGIGGSFLGPEFVYEALRYDETCKQASQGMTLKFLANVDPTDFFRATDGLDVE